MSSWNEGYVSDIGYSLGYYQELNPLRAKIGLLNKGFCYPEFKVGCELGFGQGVSINIHAAGGELDWYGTDFNPTQADFALSLSRASGAHTTLSDDSFADYIGDPDLPEFDYICMHGIWTWISDKNRECLVDFIGRKLKPGGMLYISYNTLPGWAPYLPMQHLLTLHAKNMSATSLPMRKKVDDAINFVTKILESQPIYSQKYPDFKNKLESLKNNPTEYLAHEYFNSDWHPMHFATISEWLQPAKLNFACSANYLDHIDVINLTEEQQTVLSEIPDTNTREAIRDVMVNQQFRKDYWIKGARKLTPQEQAIELRKLSIVLTAVRSDISLKISGARGEANMSPDVYDPILDILGSYQPITIGELHSAVAEKGIDFNKVLEAVMVCAGRGHVTCAQDAKTVKACKAKTKNLNRFILNHARNSGDIKVLASPVTSTGVLFSHVEQLFLVAYESGLQKESEWPEFVWDILFKQGRKLSIKGEPIDTAEGNLKELAELSASFKAGKLQLAKALEII